VYAVTGRESLTARGKLHLLTTELAADPSANYQDLFARCLLCGACEQACLRNMPVRKMVVEARSRFSYFYGQYALQKTAARAALSRPRLLEGLVKAGVVFNNLSLLPAESGLRLKLGLLEKGRRKGVETFSERSPDLGQDKRNITYFTGCLARYFQPSVAEATGQIYHKLTGNTLCIPGAQVCCGLAAWASGRQEEARSLAKKNIAAFAETTGPILTSCASCSSYLSSYPDMFADDPEWHGKACSFSNRVQEFSNFFLDKAEGGQLESKSSIKLYYHEPCHLRFDPENREAPHQLINRILNITRVDTQDGSRCCGQGGLFHVGYPELSEKIFARLYASFQEAEPDVVVTTCSGCLMQWQAGLACRNSPADAVHLAVFMAGCLGLTHISHQHRCEKSVSAEDTDSEPARPSRHAQKNTRKHT